MLTTRYSWDHFIEYLDKRTVYDMLAEGVLFDFPTRVKPDDLGIAMEEMESAEDQMKLYQLMKKSGCRFWEDHMEAVCHYTDNDELLTTMIMECGDELPDQLFHEMVSMGNYSGAVMTACKRFYARLPVDIIVEMVETDEYPPDFIYGLLSRAKDKPTYDQIEELLNCIMDDDVYKHLQPYMKGLTFEQRAQLRAEWG